MNDVLSWVENGVGRLRLNRPAALNALTLGMIRELSAALTQWADDSSVTSVHIEGAGPRGLCAGADVRALREAALAGSDDAVQGSPLLWAAPNSAMRGRFEASLLATRATLLAFGALCWRPACLLALLRQSRRLTFLLCQAAALRAVWVAVLWSVSKCRYTTPRIWRFRQRRASRLVLPSVFFFS